MSSSMIEKKLSQSVGDEDVFDARDGISQNELDERPIASGIKAKLTTCHRVSIRAKPDVIAHGNRVVSGVENKERNVHIATTLMGCVMTDRATVARGNIADGESNVVTFLELLRSTLQHRNDLVRAVVQLAAWQVAHRSLLHETLTVEETTCVHVADGLRVGRWRLRVSSS